MNFGKLPPRAASSQLRHHVLLPALPAPPSINWNEPCFSAQAGGQRRPQIFIARRGRGCKLLPHHSISPRPVALQQFPHEKQHRRGRKRRGMGKKPSHLHLSVCFSSPTCPHSSSGSCLESLTAPRTHGKNIQAAAGERGCCEEAASGHEQMQGIRCPGIR